MSDQFIYAKSNARFIDHNLKTVPKQVLSLDFSKICVSIKNLMLLDFKSNQYSGVVSNQFKEEVM